MRTLPDLFRRNRAWAERLKAETPELFEALAREQTPEYLWIGCSDSRVPANQIVDLSPGDMFVHRNVANLVIHTDLNCLSVIQYAVDVLKVKHIIVCGHYGCGGIAAALDEQEHGLIDNWLRHVEDVANLHREELQELPTFRARHDRLCELNVIRQAANVCRTTLVRGAWERGQELWVHGWIYGLEDGFLRDLSFSVEDPDELEGAYATAVANGRMSA